MESLLHILHNKPSPQVGRILSFIGGTIFQETTVTVIHTQNVSVSGNSIYQLFNVIIIFGSNSLYTHETFSPYPTSLFSCYQC